jgi:hypothetical protein
LNCFENSGFKRFGEPGMESPCFMAFALDGLKIIKTAFPCDLALELLQAIEGHSGGIGSDEMEGEDLQEKSALGEG